MATIDEASVPLSFDVDQYITQRYSGEARIQRLLWVALLNQQPNVSPEAYQTAAWTACLETIQKQGNIPRYKELYQHFHVLFSSHQNSGSADLTTSILPPYDPAWVHEAEVSSRHEREELNARLHSAQAHLNKEAVRIAYMSFSYYHVRMGDYHEALTTALRAKDFCTSRSQTAANSLQILVVALYLRNFPTVAEYAPRLENTIVAFNNSSNANASGGATTEPNASATSATTLGTMIRHKVWIALGLERLVAGDYLAAAGKFRAVAMQRPTQEQSASAMALDGISNTTNCSGSTTETAFLDDWDHTVLAPDDVAIYASILTMATETHRSADALMLTQFHPDSLERVPILAEILSYFYHKAEYRRAWELLEAHVWPVLHNDIYFGQTVPSGVGTATAATGTTMTRLAAVQERIRQKAMGLYWNAYHDCPLTSMASALGPGIAGPENSSYLRDTVLRLLLNRRVLTTDPYERYLFPMDTRFDAVTNTLVRSVLSADDERETSIRATRRQFQDTSTRVLNDTYSLIIRLSCMDRNLMITSEQMGNDRAVRDGPPSHRGGRTASRDVGRGGSSRLVHPIGAAGRAAVPSEALDHHSQTTMNDTYNESNEPEEILEQDEMIEDANPNEMNPEDLY